MYTSRLQHALDVGELQIYTYNLKYASKNHSNDPENVSLIELICYM